VFPKKTNTISKHRKENQMGKPPSSQVSAGGVVFKKSDTALIVCLISRKRDKKRVWCLPKGHVEAGEQLEETALREVREETGIKGTILAPIQSIAYQFYDQKSQQLISKTVHFFLIRYDTGDLEDHDQEVESAEWVSIEEAHKRAEHKGEREVLQAAERKLRSGEF